MVKIGSCTIIYNPDMDVISNLKKYIKYVDIAVVVDNSDEKNNICSILKNAPHLLYIDMNGNKGIAAALNLGFKILDDYGVDFVLTMDQDSIFPEQSYFDIVRLVNKFSKDYSIISLSYNCKEPCLSNQEIVDTQTWITSGNFVKIKDFNLIGGFNNELFIDYVDFDFCHRLCLKGLKIGYLKNYSLKHKIGNPIVKKILGKNIISMNHSPIRYYYRYRNIFYLYKNDKTFYRNLFYVEVFKNIVKMLFFEEKKIEKLKMIVRGVSDAQKEILGAYR